MTARLILPTEELLLRGVCRRRADDAPKLVLADYLQEQGRDGEAAALRWAAAKRRWPRPGFYAHGLTPARCWDWWNVRSVARHPMPSVGPYSPDDLPGWLLCRPGCRQPGYLEFPAQANAWRWLMIRMARLSGRGWARAWAWAPPDRAGR